MKKKMKKKMIHVLVMVSLLVSACSTKSPKREEPPATPVVIKDLLQAHGVQSRDALNVFTAVARRKTFTELGSDLPRSFERIITVARRAQFFKYQRADLQGVTKQLELFDGDRTYRAVTVRGKPVEESNQPGNSPSEAVGFEMKTFGPLPILEQLADSKTEAVYDGRSAEGWDKLRVKTRTSSWTVYADAEHLIRRVEAQDSASVYDDFRVIDGVRLPFSQQFFAKGKLYYELTFDKIDLKPAFASDYFSHEIFLKDIAR